MAYPEEFGGAFDPALLADPNNYNAQPEVRQNYVEQMQQQQAPSNFALSGNRYVTENPQADLMQILEDARSGNVRTVQPPLKDEETKLSYPALDVVADVKNLTTSNKPKAKRNVPEQIDEMSLDPIEISVDYDGSPYVRDLSGYGNYLDALSAQEAESGGRRDSGGMAKALQGDTPIQMLESDRRQDQQELDALYKGGSQVLNQASLANQLERAYRRDSMQGQQAGAGLAQQLLNSLTRGSKSNKPELTNADYLKLTQMRADGVFDGALTKSEATDLLRR